MSSVLLTTFLGVLGEPCFGVPNWSGFLGGVTIAPDEEASERAGELSAPLYESIPNGLSAGSEWGPFGVVGESMDADGGFEVGTGGGCFPGDITVTFVIGWSGFNGFEWNLENFSFKSRGLATVPSDADRGPGFGSLTWAGIADRGEMPPLLWCVESTEPCVLLMAELSDTVLFDRVLLVEFWSGGVGVNPSSSTTSSIVFWPGISISLISSFNLLIISSISIGTNSYFWIQKKIRFGFNPKSADKWNLPLVLRH